MSRATYGARLALLFMALVVVAGVAIVVGATAIDSRALWAPTAADPTQAAILWELRLPRVALALTVGAALALAGSAYQAMFRNPLADPFVIGASGGAALGATAAIVAGLTLGVGGFAAVPGAAFVGALVAVALVVAVGGLGPRASPLTLLLAGAAVSTLLSALTSLMILIDDRSLQSVYYWLLGGFSGKGWTHVWQTALYLVPGAAALLLTARALDALAVGDETARSLGLPLLPARLGVVVAASLVTAAAVAAGGVIGFVGLMAPHLARLYVGAGHRRLLPAAALSGALLTVAADAVARVALAPVEIPVGVVTSVIGGPFFLWVLRATGGAPRGDS